MVEDPEIGVAGAPFDGVDVASPEDGYGDGGSPGGVRGDHLPFWARSPPRVSLLGLLFCFILCNFVAVNKAKQYERDLERHCGVRGAIPN